MTGFWTSESPAIAAAWQRFTRSQLSRPDRAPGLMWSEWLCRCLADYDARMIFTAEGERIAFGSAEAMGFFLLKWS